MWNKINAELMLTVPRTVQHSFFKNLSAAVENRTCFLNTRFIVNEEHSYAMERNRSTGRDRSKDLERSNIKMFTHF